jgi:hypothetical protein
LVKINNNFAVYKFSKPAMMAEWLSICKKTRKTENRSQKIVCLYFLSLLSKRSSVFTAYSSQENANFLGVDHIADLHFKITRERSKVNNMDERGIKNVTV